MGSIFDTARYILSQKGAMTTWKLQKLCYYAQAWSLAWTGKPLFDEEFEAWENGPVSPVLFRRHQGYFMIDADRFHDGDSSRLTEDEKDTIDTVLKDYGDMEPYALRELSHSELPWKTARGDLPPSAKCSVVISKESMGEYYGSL